MNNIFFIQLPADSPQLEKKAQMLVRKKKGNELEADDTANAEDKLKVYQEFLTDEELEAIRRAPNWPVISTLIVIAAIGLGTLLFVLARPDKIPPPEISNLKIVETEAGSIKGTIPAIQGDDKSWHDFSHGLVTISEEGSSETIYQTRFEKNGLAFEVPANKVVPDSSYIVQAKTVDLKGNESRGITESLITRTPEVKDLASRFEQGAIVWEWSDSTEGHIRITGPGNSLLVDEDYNSVHSYSFSDPASFKIGAVFTALVRNQGRHGFSSGIQKSFTIPDTTIYHTLPFSGRAEKNPRVFNGRINTEGLTPSCAKFVVAYNYDAQSETNHAKNQVTMAVQNASNSQIGETKRFVFDSTSSSGGPWWQAGWVAETPRQEVWELSYQQLSSISSITITIQAGDWAMAVDGIKYHFE